MIRVAAAALCVLIGLYWLAVASPPFRTGGGGFRVLVGTFTSFWLAAAVYPVFARRVRIGAAFAVLPVIAIGLGLFAAVGPWLLNDWIRGDYDRYVWVIHQADPCRAMGGGPGMLWVFGMSWLAALGAFVYAATFPLTARRVVVSAALGVALLGLTAVAMFPDPAVFARVLGCM